MAILKRSGDGDISSKQRLVTDASLGNQDNVLWESPTTGALWLTGSVLHCRLRIDDSDVDLRVDGSSGGSFDAEGWLGKRPWRWLLPCRYDVWNLYAPGVVDGRSAVAHVEYNCGRAFPKNWIWSQAHNPRFRSALLVVGGDFLPGIPRTWLLAYRSPVVGEINLRTVDPRTSAVESLVDPSTGAFRLTLRTPKYLVDLAVSADPASFFPDPLFVPTPTGFTNDPGSTESFAATAHVRIYEPSGDTDSFRLIETRSFDSAALEFGGDFSRSTTNVETSTSFAS